MIYKTGSSMSKMSKPEDTDGLLGCVIYFFLSYPINWAVIKFITIPYMIEKGEELNQAHLTILFVAAPITLPIQGFIILMKGMMESGCNLTEVLF